MTKQLGSHNVIVNAGVIVDASITDNLRKPKGFKGYAVVEDRKEHSDEETSIDMSGSEANKQEGCIQKYPKTP